MCPCIDEKFILLTLSTRNGKWTCAHTPHHQLFFLLPWPKRSTLFLLFALQQFLKNLVFVTGNKVPSTKRATKTSFTIMDFEYTWLSEPVRWYKQHYNIRWRLLHYYTEMISSFWEILFHRWEYRSKMEKSQSPIDHHLMKIYKQANPRSYCRNRTLPSFVPTSTIGTPGA